MIGINEVELILIAMVLLQIIVKGGLIIVVIKILEQVVNVDDIKSGHLLKHLYTEVVSLFLCKIGINILECALQFIP